MPKPSIEQSKRGLERRRDETLLTSWRNSWGARIQELEKQKTPPPAFVKADVKKPATQEKKPRKKREAQYNRARKRSVPTQIVDHRLVECPDCHLRLGGISLARSREVIAAPPPPVVGVTEHRLYIG